MTRKRVKRSLSKRLQLLETRRVLAAPVVMDDAYEVSEDQVLSLSGQLIDTQFDRQALSLGANWDYLDLLQNSLGNNDDYPTDGQGNEWLAPEFDVSTSTVGPWGIQQPAMLAAGAIGFGPTATNLDGLGGGPNNQNLVNTYLFRTTIELTAEEAAAGQGSAEILCDDGCIVYVNGQEATRLNMDPANFQPAGALTPDTLTANGVENSLTTLNFNTAGLNLVEGTNHVAVELHQGTTFSSDAGFDMSLDFGNSSTGGFTYQDDILGTAVPDLAQGSVTDQGLTGNGLSVTLGPGPTPGFEPTSGGWTREFRLADAATIEVGVSFRLVLDEGYEGNEFGAAFLAINDTFYGNGPNDSLVQITGNGNGGGFDDSGWLSETFQISLDAGLHTISLAAFNNQATFDDESTFAFFDDVTVGIVGQGSSVLANDTDPDGDPITVQSNTDPANGSVDMQPDGSFVYTPAPNFNGTDSFTYIAFDGTESSEPATVVIVVTPVPDPPIAVDDQYTLDEDEVYTRNARRGVLGNDSDVDGDELSAFVASGPNNGQLVLNANGSFTYTPNPEFSGTDSFTYIASDGVLTDTATVSLTIEPVDDPPVAVDDVYQLEENTQLIVTEAIQPQPVVFFSTDFDAGVPVEFSGPGELGAEGVQGYGGVGHPGNQFSGQLLRNTAGGNPAAATVLTLNNLPEHSHIDIGFLLAIIDSWEGNNGNGSPDRLNIEVDGQSVFSETFDTANSTDQTYSPPDSALLVDGENLGFVIFGGRFVDSAYDMNFESSLQYIPHTADTLTIRWFGSGPGWTGGTESFALDNVTITLHNDQGDIDYGVLSNDFDLEGSPLTANLLAEPENGVLNISDDGTFTYVPNPNFFGTDSFTYFASDGTNESGLATVVLNVAPGPNDIPVVLPDTYDTLEDQQLTVNNSDGVLANDSDPDGDIILASLISTTSNGELHLFVDGSFIYTPNPNFFGTDSFTYVANDPQTSSAQTTVLINVAPVNDVGVPGDDEYFLATSTESIQVDAAAGLLQNDFDVDGDIMTVSVVPPDEHFDFTWNADGSFAFTPSHDCPSVFQFQYTVSDGMSTSEPAIVTVHVPLSGGQDDSYTLDEDNLLDVPFGSGVLANDQGQSLNARLLTPPVNGELMFRDDGSFLYVPAADFSGTDSFQYVAGDGFRETVPHDVELRVVASADAPRANNESYELIEGTTLSVPAAEGVLANDTDPDSANIFATLLVDVAQGVLDLENDGALEYTPPAGFSGTVSFSYAATDGVLDSAQQTVEIDVIRAADLVVINEVMYHPQSELNTEEFIELYNPTTVDLDLTGWQFTSGVSYTFPNGASLPANGYLVVAADLAVFSAKYPGVTNVVGGWVGQLSNQGENIELSDANGDRIDRATYYDQGEWSQRVESPVDQGHTGWEWNSEHDGLGKSIEVVNWAVSNREGQNWLASIPLDGTPGAQNSVAQSDIAPFIVDVEHSPAVPTSTENVVITADIRDDNDLPVSATLRYRVASLTPGLFESVVMVDDGTGDDVEAGDGIFTATLPPQSNMSVVEFYVHASDGTLERTQPGPTDEFGTQGANYLYQVDETEYAGGQPVFRVVMSAQEAAEFQAINRNSNAEMNSTVIFTEGTGESIRYNAGVRVRGASSRFRNPPGIKVNLPHNDPWNSVVSMNLNNQFTWLQTAGHGLMRLSGIGAYEVTPIQLRLNGINYANAGSPQHGSYVYSEAANSDFIANHYPNDPNGNLYKKVRPDNKWDFRNGDPLAYMDDGWSKETNSGQNDWSDLDNFMFVMNNTQAGPDYFDTINQIVDVEQWVRWFAAMMIMNNRETNLSNGTDDDYLMYRGVEDPRFHLVPHDLDTIFGQGDTQTDPVATIFPAVTDTFANQLMPQLVPFFNDPTILNMYYDVVDELTSTVFAPENLGPFLDNTLSGYVPQGTIDQMKSFALTRVNFIRTQLPAVIDVAPVALIDGEPPAVTPFDNATLVVSGDGLVSYRYSLNGEPFGPVTPALTPIELNGLAPGAQQVRVIGQNSSGTWQAAASVSNQWTVAPDYSPLIISEVLADNVGSVPVQGTFPDYIELFNSSPQPIDLTGLSITDDASTPDRFVFPAGTMIGAGEYLVLYADTSDELPGIHLGFALSAAGESVSLFDSAANGGTLLDSVTFGLQIADFAIGRNADFHFELNLPTPGLPNQTQPLGDATQLKINEWLADGQGFYRSDRIEIFNSEVLPVAIGEFYMTDSAPDFPDLHQVTPLSFLPGESYTTFVADKDLAAGADHLDFFLSSFTEIIGLFDQDLALIDQVYYGPQTTDVSMGRSPDGSAIIKPFTPPSFGAANPETLEEFVSLMEITDVWAYDDTNTDLGDGWRALDFDDSAWPRGGGLFFNENEPLPAPTTTPITNGATTYYFRSTFTANDFADSELLLTTVIDDGAIIYINNQEVFRLGMPDGPVTAATNANRSINEAAYEGPFTIPIDVLIDGENQIAVELHNSTTGGGDTVFGMELVLEKNTVVGELPDAVRLNEHLRITEVMYDPIEGSDLEFVELQNVGDTPLQLAGVQLENAISFTFPTMTLEPGAYTVVVNDLPSFEARYGDQLPVAGEYSGNLKNDEENIELSLPSPFNGRILDFTYRDDWYPETDGSGPSLVIVDANADTAMWDVAAGWRPSHVIGGSPGADDVPPPPTVTVTPLVTNVVSPELRGTVSDPSASVQLQLNGLIYDAINLGDGTWHLPAGVVNRLSENVYEVFARAIGPFGIGIDQTQNELSIDRTQPVVTVVPFDTTTPQPEFSGTVDSPSATIQVHIAGHSYIVANNQGNWVLPAGSLREDLTSGEVHVCVVALDEAGNYGYTFTDAIMDLGTPLLRVEDVAINVGQVDPPPRPDLPLPTTWDQQRSTISRIDVTFNTDVIANVGDVRLTNLGVNAPADPDQEIVIQADEFSVTGNVLTLSFDSRALPDGLYELAILPSATNTLGEALDGDANGVAGGTFVLTGDQDNRFYQLTADWNGDTGASIFDFPVFSYWFGTLLPAAPAYVDLNRDGGVSIFDFPQFAAVFASRIEFMPAARTVEGGTEVALELVEEVQEHPLQRPFGSEDGVARLESRQPESLAGREVEQWEDLLDLLANDWL